MTKRAFLFIYDDRFVFGDSTYYRKDVESYYSNHIAKDCADKFGLSLASFKKIVSKWKLKKTKEEIRKLTEKTKFERYGDAHYNNINKNRETLIKKYGSLEDAYKEQSRRCRESKRVKYGDPNYNNVCKNRQTCLEKYGVDNVFKSEEIKEKIRNTSRKKYGVDWMTKSEQMKKHNEDTCLKKFGNKTYLGSNVDMMYRQSNCEKIKLKRRQAYEHILRNNSNYYFDIAVKVCETKKKNNTFNKSQAEDYFYNFLCNKFGKDNIIRQYKDVERYPYCCDFYISTLDLFIEINNYWTHGKHPFNEECEDDLKVVKNWRQKQRIRKNGKPNSYYVAEYVWTVTDVDKLQCAVKNNLNYIMIYNDTAYDKNLNVIDVDSFCLNIQKE